MKYHIFIGSTLDDLKNERMNISRIIMELGHIPVSAEYLDSSEKNYDRLLEKIIDECNYFIALIAHKYSATGKKTSPMETEFNIARKKRIPVIPLIIDEKARWKVSKKEKDTELIKKLDDFKNELREEMHITWFNTGDLCQKTQSILIQKMNLMPQNGWIKSDQAVIPTVANELSRLSTENEQLRKQIIIEDDDIINKLRNQMKSALKILTSNKVILSFYYSTGENWENSKKIRYLRIFKLLAPELGMTKSTAEISRFLGAVLNPDLEKIVRGDFPTPSNSIKKIMVDFSMLKLVRCINRDEIKSAAGSIVARSSIDEIWEITEYGKELYFACRMKQLEKSAEKPNE